MTYGVIIDGVNTKTTYDLILCADLNIEEPAPRTAFVTIPGKSGSYDFSDVLAARLCSTIARLPSACLRRLRTDG